MNRLLGLPLIVLATACGGGAINLGDGPSDTCPAARVDGEALDWPGARLAEVQEQVLVVTNDCTANNGDLVISAAVEGSDAFAVDGTEITLAPGTSAEIVVGFSAQAYAPTEGVLRIATNDPNVPELLVQLSASTAPDQDGDGYLAVEAGGEDCDDLDPQVNPGSAETWYDGVDQDCDGASDFDQDNDGEDRSPEGGDCDDLDPAVRPGASERDNLADDDCDGLVDEDFIRPGDVYISEVMADPVAVFDTSGEWFEVYNNSPRSLDLVGWRVTDNAGDAFTVPRSVVVEPGGFLVFGIEGDVSRNGGVRVDVVYSRDNLELGNAADTLGLLVEGNTVALLEYDSSFAGEAGASLALDRQSFTPGRATVGGYWCASTSVLAGGDKGTPGAPNDLCPRVDHDGDGLSVASGDCDDADPSVYPRAPERWNGVDNDCNGTVDDADRSDLETGWVEGDSSNYLSAMTSMGVGDLDGDGDLEMLIGSSRDGGSYAGIVYVVDSSKADTWADGIYDVDQAIITSSGTYNGMGNVSAYLGDQDGDGNDDIVISGASGYTSTTDAAVLLFTDAASLSGSNNQDDATAYWYGAQYGYDFNKVASNVDVDGDGLDEIVYGYTYATVGGSAYAGSIYMLDASKASGALSLTSAERTWSAGTYYELLGSTVEGADVDGDGYGDVLACAQYADSGSTNSGSCYLIFGASSVPSSGDISDRADLTIDGRTANERLGYAGRAHFADLQDDGALDLVLPNPYKDEVLVYFDVGSSSGDLDTSDADVVLRSRRGPIYFGTGLAVGDFDGDGTDDVAVGAPDTLYHMGYGADEPGQVTVWNGDEIAAASGSLDERDARGSVVGLSTTDAFGFSLIGADFDGDGIDDLAVGSPNDASGRGRVSFFIMD